MLSRCPACLPTAMSRCHHAAPGKSGAAALSQVLTSPQSAQTHFLVAVQQLWFTVVGRTATRHAALLLIQCRPSCQQPQCQDYAAAVPTGSQVGGNLQAMQSGLASCSRAEQHRAQPSFRRLPVVACRPDRINWWARYGPRAVFCLLLV